MPPDSTTVYDFTAPQVDLTPYRIFGGLLPMPAQGMGLLFVAVLFAVFVGVAQARLSPKRWNLLSAASVALTFAATYVLSVRWLDDLFVNLAHPYNWVHHGLFSVSPSHPADGTVEFVYYALLAPFAFDRIVLVYAAYGVGAALGVAHLLCFARFLRGVPPAHRFLALTVLAAWIPVVQTWASGYGNALVTLLYLFAAWCVVRNRTRPLAVLCFVMPLLRPDALLYSASLVLMYVVLHRTWRVPWCLPTLFAPPLYALLVYALFHQWVPTPVLFKAVTPDELITAAPDALKETITVYLLGTWERQIMLLLAGAFFLLPRPPGLSVSKRVIGAWLLSTVPILLVFRITGAIGYNPTNYRYYAPFEIALCVAGVLGMLSAIAAIRAALERKNDFGIVGFLRRNIEPEPNIPPLDLRPLGKQVVCYSAALWLLLQFGRIDDSMRRHDYHTWGWMGEDVGIETTYYDLERLANLRFGGEYFAPMIPHGWKVAVTEMDTFGYFGGRDIVDLWGFSTMEIATAPTKTDRTKVRNNTTFFYNSNTPVFWVRTFEAVGEFERMYHELTSPDMNRFAVALWQFPNFTSSYCQAGDLRVTLKKYAVVRVFHGTNQVTLFFVRRDLVSEFNKSLVDAGLRHRTTQTMPFSHYFKPKVTPLKPVRQ